MSELEFRDRTVLANTDGEWRTSVTIRGALHMSVRQAAVVLTRLRRQGLVTSRANDHVHRTEWMLTDKGRDALMAP